MDNRAGLMLLCLFFRSTANMCEMDERCQYYWLSKLDNLNIQLPSYISQFSKRTKQTCAQACNENSSCTLFRINRNDGSCLLLPAFFPVVIKAMHPGLQYYHRGSEKCPAGKGYTAFDSPPGCYSIRPVNKTWSEAKTDCEGDGGHLAVLEDLPIQLRLIADVKALLMNDTDYGVHVGLDDKVTEGKFVWADGRELSNSFWAPHHPYGSTAENCVAVFVDGLHDVSCAVSMYYMCQIDI